MFETILDVYKASLRSFQNFKISFLKRQADNVVHLLIRHHYLMLVLIFMSTYMSSCIKNIIIIIEMS